VKVVIGWFSSPVCGGPSLFLYTRQIMWTDAGHSLRARLTGEMAEEEPGQFFRWPAEWHGESEQVICV